MPRIENGKEVLSWPLYDSITLGAADIAATLFTVPQGQSSKTLYNTNMKESGKMPWPDSYTFEGVRFIMPFDQTAALAVALMKGTFSLVIGTKSYFDVPLFRIPGASGIYVAAQDDTTAATVTYGQSGQPLQESLYTFAIPLTLEPGETFRVELAWPVAPTAALFWIMFDGTMRRSIQ
jgi:hypothetical protein